MSALGGHTMTATPQSAINAMYVQLRRNAVPNTCPRPTERTKLAAIAQPVAYTEVSHAHHTNSQVKLPQATLPIFQYMLAMIGLMRARRHVAGKHAPGNNHSNQPSALLACLRVMIQSIGQLLIPMVGW